MILISHRGNLRGPNPKLENTPNYINDALLNGYDVEIDIRYINGYYFLGHDYPEHTVSRKFIENKNLWIHCKDYDTLSHFIDMYQDLNFFYHTNEDYVITSKNYIWAYPGKYGTKNTIAVMPELSNISVVNFEGVCSDYVESYRT